MPAQQQQGQQQAADGTDDHAGVFTKAGAGQAITQVENYRIINAVIGEIIGHLEAGQQKQCAEAGDKKQAAADQAVAAFLPQQQCR